ncbi:MAG: hypothetical protein R3212_04285, partial [Xanthomonadales bacterium]|nr:hypothetical protein [Xanthomonadales bacterium]
YILNAHGIPALDGDERVSPAGDVQWAGDREWVGAGNGFARYTGLAERRGQLAAVYSELWPTATGLIPTAEAWLANQEPLAAHLAQPLYIRDHVADKPQD